MAKKIAAPSVAIVSNNNGEKPEPVLFNRHIEAHTHPASPLGVFMENP
jgi:hypothetical protein